MNISPRSKFVKCFQGKDGKVMVTATKEQKLESLAIRLGAFKDAALALATKGEGFTDAELVYLQKLLISEAGACAEELRELTYNEFYKAG